MMTGFLSSTSSEVYQSTKESESPTKDQGFPSLILTASSSQNTMTVQPTYTAEDMTDAIEKACQKTALEVEEETRTVLSKEHHQRQTEALEAIRDQLKSKEVLFENWLSDAAVTAQHLAKMMGQTLIPRALDQHPLADIEDIIRQSLLRLLGQPSIEIQLGAMLLEEELSLFEKLAKETRFLGELTVSKDSELNAGDAKVIWKEGIIERDLERLKKEAESIIDAWVPDDTKTHSADQIMVVEKQHELNQKSSEE